MEFFEAPILETERLRLRPLRKSDIDDYAALNADPEVMRYVGGPWDRGRAWRHLAFLMGHWQLGGAGMWAVELRANGAFVWVVGFAEPEGWPGCEAAWKLARRWWGHGYATEAARAALGYAFSIWKKDRIVSLIEPGNLASIRVAEHGRGSARPQRHPGPRAPRLWAGPGNLRGADGTVPPSPGRWEADGRGGPGG